MVALAAVGVNGPFRMSCPRRMVLFTNIFHVGAIAFTRAPTLFSIGAPITLMRISVRSTDLIVLFATIERLASDVVAVVIRGCITLNRIAPATIPMIANKKYLAKRENTILVLRKKIRHGVRQHLLGQHMEMVRE